MPNYTRGERAKLGVASLGLVAAAAVAFVGVSESHADAATIACASGGAFTGFCGTQTNSSSTPLAFNVYQAAPKYDAKIWGYKPSDQNGAEDFIWQAYNGGAAKEAIYAPNGVPAVSAGHNLCVSEPSKLGGFVLRFCNGTKYQLFTAASAGLGYTWTNEQFGDIANADGGQIVGAAANGTVHHSEEFNFTTTQAPQA